MLFASSDGLYEGCAGENDVYADPAGGTLRRAGAGFHYRGPGNRFRNLNTGQSYPFPTFVNNSGVLEVLKGVYVVSFDGDALFQDGSHATVRFTEWGTPSSAITLMEDRQELVLKMVVLR